MNAIPASLGIYSVSDAARITGAHALRILAEADAIGSPEPMEVLHALDFVEQGMPDITLIQAVTDGAHCKAVLITTDKAMRTRQHERAAFVDTGCIGIVLRGRWNHASLWDRARLSLLWWTTWTTRVCYRPAEVDPP